MSGFAPRAKPLFFRQSERQKVMTKMPDTARAKRVGQTLFVALALAVLAAAAASAQWGWSQQGSSGGWWSGQPAGPARREAQRTRRAQQPSAPYQHYAPPQHYPRQQQRRVQQQQPAPYYPSNYPHAPYRYVAPSGQQQQWFTPPTVAYGPPAERSSRPARSDAARAVVKIPQADKPDQSPSTPGGGETTFCVRLCDGRFFPLSGETKATSQKLCGALCPAARTKVFEGSSIDEARASDGTRYEKLGNAFRFRKELVADCTCNGKNAFGLAKIDINADPTLEPGDIVVMADGLKVFAGTQGGRRSRTARFTPIRRSSLVSRSFRRTLDGVEIAKTRPRAGQHRQAQQAQQ